MVNDFGICDILTWIHHGKNSIGSSDCTGQLQVDMHANLRKRFASRNLSQ